MLVADRDPYSLAASIGALLSDAPGAGPCPRRAVSGFASSTWPQRLSGSWTCWCRWPAPAPVLVLALVRVTVRVPGLHGHEGRALPVTERGVHQFVPMLHRADAVGRHTLRLRDVLVGARDRVAGSTSIWSTPRRSPRHGPTTRYPAEARPGDVLLYQFATASALARWLAGRPETLVVNYHNVTPPEYYAPWDNGLARHQLRAQGELRLLAPRAALGLTVSAFNEAELRAAGFARTAVVPPAAMLPVAARRGAARRRRHVAARWVTVGRLGAEQGHRGCARRRSLVARAHHDPDATLEVVGRPDVAPYGRALHRFVDELGLRHRRHLHGARSDADVAAALATADVYVSLRGTKDSASPSSKPWRRAFRSWPTLPVRCPRWWATEASW